MSLLDRAKAVVIQRRRGPKVCGEDIDLALAWARGEIAISQVSAVYSRSGKPSNNNAYVKLAFALGHAVQAGRLTEAKPEGTDGGQTI